MILVFFEFLQNAFNIIRFLFCFNSNESKGNDESPWKTQPELTEQQKQSPPSNVVSKEVHEHAPPANNTPSPVQPTTTEIKERPRLNLAPRTIPVEESSSSQVASASAIFGAAKPVNTAAREKEIEERLKKERELNAAEKEKKSTSITESTHSAEHQHDSSQ